MTIAMILTAVAAAITEIDATAYQQSTTAPEEWRENEQVFPLDGDADSYDGHLRFSVLWEEAPNTGSLRDDHGGEIELDTLLVVIFAYNIRAGKQRDDLKLASDAALDVMRTVNHQSAWGNDQVHVQVVEAARLGWFDSQFVHIRSTYRVQHTVGV